MNANQQAKYGRIVTRSFGPLRRVADCPICGLRITVNKRGNALGDAARCRGEVMAHMRIQHPQES